MVSRLSEGSQSSSKPSERREWSRTKWIARLTTSSTFLFALDRSPSRGGRADQSDVFSIDILASSTSISPLPTTRGSTWSNAGSTPPLPKNCNAPPITTSANSPTTSPPGSDHGTKTPNRSLGTKPPNRSSTRSPRYCRQINPTTTTPPLTNATLEPDRTPKTRNHTEVGFDRRPTPVVRYRSARASPIVRSHS